MRKALLVSAVAVGASALAFAQGGVAGKWMGETQGRGGPQTVTLELMVKGDALMGTFTQGQQPASEITDGKVVDASTVTFSRSFTGRGGNAVTLNYTGKLSGEELTLTVEFPGGGPGGGGPGGGRGPMPIVLKRG